MLPQSSEAGCKLHDALSAFMDALYTMVNVGDVRGAHEAVALLATKLLLDRVRSGSSH